MKQALVRNLQEAMRQDERIILVTGDLGFHMFEPLMTEFPERCINVGIMEQTMVGFAAGLAMSGKLPVIYSISSFLTMRAFEQIRNDLVLQQLHAILIGSSAGYEQLGPTHHTDDDLRLMEVLGVSIYAPRNTEYLAMALHNAITRPGTHYLRLGTIMVEDRQGSDGPP